MSTLPTNREIIQKAIDTLGNIGMGLRVDDFKSKSNWDRLGKKIKEGEEPFFTLEQLIPVKYTMFGLELTTAPVKNGEQREGFKASKVKLYHISQVE